MVSTSGSRLLRDDAMDALVNLLLPLAAVITPNIPEAETLTGITISDTQSAEIAAKKLSHMCAGAVLVKGGHSLDSGDTEAADDLLYLNGRFIWIKGERISNPNTHGTGCTLSSAIACNLAKGLDMETSVRKAKGYISGALKAGLNLGTGRGPLNHCYALENNVLLF
jgi:hydroxymethylpyrimidine/phosphomethylpyrimidine kinase